MPHVMNRHSHIGHLSLGECMCLVLRAWPWTSLDTQPWTTLEYKKQMWVSQTTCTDAKHFAGKGGSAKKSIGFLCFGISAKLVVTHKLQK